MALPNLEQAFCPITCDILQAQVEIICKYDVLEVLYFRLLNRFYALYYALMDIMVI